MVVVFDENPAATPESEGPSSTKKRGGGPKTDPGKLRSRASAFQHGFRARVVFSDDMAEAIRARKAMLIEQFQPQTEYQHTLIADMALARVKLDRVEELLPANCDRAVERGLNFWDHDQKTLALNLAARLPKDPARFAHVLAGTKHGAALMIERWEGLAQIAASCGDWDAAQRRMALDLLGIPIELQPGCSAIAPPGDKEALIALATQQIERLRTLIDVVLDDQDAQNQADAIAGILAADDADTKLLRTYERSARRDYDRAHAELLRVQAEAAAAARARREREIQELLTPQEVRPEEQQASAAAPPLTPEQQAMKIAQREARIDRVMARMRAMDAEARSASDSATEGTVVAPPEREFASGLRRSAQRQAGPSGG
jgi:hypothetical protein